MSTSGGLAGKIAATSFLSREWLGEFQIRARGEFGKVPWRRYHRAVKALGPSHGDGLEGPLVLLRLDPEGPAAFPLFLHWAAASRPARPAATPAALTTVQAAKARYRTDVGLWADHVCDCHACTQLNYCATARRLKQRVRRSMAALKAAYEAEPQSGPP
jgi:hypothetical protein